MIPDLLRWYAGHRRDLPWRRDPSPWRVLVAETMLQQTTVAAVLPRYEAFLARYPTPAAMAAAAESDVLADWSGLGYYHRARNLRAAAAAIAERHGGEVPGDPAAVRALPGVGEYTAGAVLSIAFGRPEPVLDGNVERVLSRVHLVAGDPKRSATRGRLRALAAEAVRAGPPAEVNQALMELGALVCRPAAPRCGECPLAHHCAARREGVAEELPERRSRPAPREVGLVAGIVRRGGAVLLAPAPAGGFVAGTYAPPFAEVRPEEEPAAALARGARERYGLALTPGAALGWSTHAITRHRITLTSLAAVAAAGPLPVGALYAAEAELPRLALSSLARKALRPAHGPA